VHGLADEGTRQRYALLDLLARTPGAITLGRGDPDLATPKPIVDAAIDAIARGVDAPTAVEGLPELRAAIARRLADHHGVIADPEREVVVTTGGQEAIFLLLAAILQPGDEILMPDPRYTAYDVAVAAAGATIVSVPPAPGSPVAFDLDAAAIEAAITPRTKALLLITPGNPTGAVAARADLERVAAVARRHGLLVISDEMYERIRYDGIEHVSMASLPGMAASTVTVGGFSKAYAMTGWRVGFVAGPAALMEQVRAGKRRWSGCAPVVAQHAALAALTGAQEPVEAMLREYAARRAIALPALARMGLPVSPSQGAFYAFVETEALGIPSAELSRRLLVEAGVFLYPGSGFGARWSTHLRLAWLQPQPRLIEALERMERWIG
jgi:aminotransferase